MKQSSREALIDLLFLALYLDDRLSLAEDEVLTGALDSLGWESERSRERFIFRAFSQARAAAADPLRTEEFLASHAEVFKADGSGAEAFTWLTKILAADGLSYSEKRFLSDLEARLFP